MKYLTVLALISVAATAKLENIGANDQAAASNSDVASTSANAKILSYDNNNIDIDYMYSYKTSDGIEVEQEGRLVPELQVYGSYSYVGDDGKTYSVSYMADEYGFKARGEHLPTPPPIPEAIRKSLILTTGTDKWFPSYTPSGILIGSPLWKLLTETKLS